MGTSIQCTRRSPQGRALPKLSELNIGNHFHNSFTDDAYPETITKIHNLEMIHSKKVKYHSM